MKFKATIEKWRVEPVGNMGYWVTGFFLDHPDFPPEKFCHTSLIQEINFEEGWVRTENSIYKLKE